MDYLEKIDPTISTHYIEYLINEKVLANKGMKQKVEVYSRLLCFIDTTDHYHPNHLYGLLLQSLYKAQAVLLGCMGRHEHALELYVYKLKNYAKAEEYILQANI
ncbi:hypothetical protein BDR04DRAFT_1212113 [Suillus decipiens]|nr:hypothetical protein BDR04DRAFT_1212113 [Suillus decipiens]